MPMPKSKAPKPPTRRFAIWTTTGESEIWEGTSLGEVTRRLERSMNKQIVCVVEMEYLVKPGAADLPFLVAVVGNRQPKS